MTDTSTEIPEIQSPVLDLDAMLKTLHEEFSEVEDETGGDPGEGGDGSPQLENEKANQHSGDGSDDVDNLRGDDGSGRDDLGDLLPPGYVRVGEEVLPETEVKALLELNRRVKDDPGTATRVREAVLGQQTQAKPAEDPDALPIWIDPDDERAVFSYRHSQRIEREVEELKADRARDLAQQTQAQQQARETEVRDAFRTSMKEFRDEFPYFDLEDLNKIANRAANMGLLEHPEKVGGTLKGGIVTALETAMWSDPTYREKATAGATVRTKQEKSATRKQKSSALSSSTGSVVRTQSQEQVPTTRKEIMAAGLEFLRSGQASD